MAIFKFNLGDQVKDLVTNIAGIIVARTEWLNGCKRYQLDRPVNKDGSLPDDISVDEAQCEMVKPLKVNVGQPIDGEKEKPRPGGPRPNQTRSRSTPKAFGR